MECDVNKYKGFGGWLIFHAFFLVIRGYNLMLTISPIYLGTNYENLANLFAVRPSAVIISAILLAATIVAICVQFWVAGQLVARQANSQDMIIRVLAASAAFYVVATIGYTLEFDELTVPNILLPLADFLFPAILVSYLQRSVRVRETFVEQRSVRPAFMGVSGMGFKGEKYSRRTFAAFYVSIIGTAFVLDIFRNDPALKAFPHFSVHFVYWTFMTYLFYQLYLLYSAIVGRLVDAGIKKLHWIWFLLPPFSMVTVLYLLFVKTKRDFENEYKKYSENLRDENSLRVSRGEEALGIPTYELWLQANTALPYQKYVETLKLENDLRNQRGAERIEILTQSQWMAANMLRDQS